MMRRKETLKISERKRDALVLIDVINDFNFPGSQALLRYAVPECIAALKERATRARIPIIYATTISASGVLTFTSKLNIVCRKETAAGKLSNFSNPPKRTSLS